MEYVKLYLKEKLTWITAYFLFIMIFIFSFVLYNLPIKAVIYPAVVSSVIAAFFLVYDAVKHIKKHMLLKNLAKANDNILDDLNSALCVDDKDYREIIGNLIEKMNAQIGKEDALYRDTVNYYTMWAHQIKTPIASMKLSLQNEDSELSRKLSAELYRIEQYVQMVLAYIRLDSKSNDYVFKNLLIDDIVKKSVKSFSTEFILKKISLDYRELSFYAVTDEKWLSFVIEQIISNALKYTKKGVIKIYGQANVLCIEDSGIGISKSDLPRIFENGFTGNNGRENKRASGIGLYLCKRICDNLNIKISVSSELNVGTKVYLDFSQNNMKVE